MILRDEDVEFINKYLKSYYENMSVFPSMKIRKATTLLFSPGTKDVNLMFNQGAWCEVLGRDPFAHLVPLMDPLFLEE